MEADLFHSCFEAYQLLTSAFRLDTTTCGYPTIEDDGVMQLGHGKDPRPDLPRLKIIAAVTQPLAFSVVTDVVAGNTSDDELYWPTGVKVKEKVGGVGLLFCGDCKTVALRTRAPIAAAGAYYLTVLPLIGETAQQVGSWIEEALQQEEAWRLVQVHKPKEEEADEPTAGFGGAERAEEREESRHGRLPPEGATKAMLPGQR